jgi:outer membrane protein OmpA-like peptidoglycan-associated protein
VRLRTKHVFSGFLAVAVLGCQVHATGTANVAANVDTRASASASAKPPAPERADAASAQAPTRTVFATVLIEFDTDKWDLDAGDKKNLAEFIDDICAAHAKEPTKTVVVEGHADARASAAHNMELSRHRAETIRQWVIDNNKLCTIDPSQIIVQAVGEGEPRSCHEPAQCIASDNAQLGPDSKCKKCWEKNRETVFSLQAPTTPAGAAPPAPPAPTAPNTVVRSGCSRVLVLGEERGSRMCEQGKGSGG